MKNKTALIFGISGQDGFYLSEHLLRLNYNVYGTSRHNDQNQFNNHKHYNIFNKIKIFRVPNDSKKDIQLAIEKSNPDEIYFLSAQSSVAISYENPEETYNSNVLKIVKILEFVKFFNKKIKVFNAVSSECFGNLTASNPANESTPFNPMSPYAISKCSTYWIIKNYRENYNMFCCNGILFNHISPLRQETFVTKKIVLAASKIANGLQEKLTLGRLDVYRDWGWAPEYVEAMHLILNHQIPDDFIIASGKSYNLQKFVEITFSHFDLDWQEFVEIDQIRNA